MSAEQNKALERRIFDELNKGNLAVADELFVNDYVYHGPPGGMSAQSSEEFKQMITMLRSAFPDFNMKIEEMIAEGEIVCTRATYSGTHKGEFLGAPPTGKQFSVAAQVMARFVRGKEVEAWGIVDSASMLQQLGIQPPRKG